MYNHRLKHSLLNELRARTEGSPPSRALALSLAEAPELVAQSNVEKYRSLFGTNLKYLLVQIYVLRPHLAVMEDFISSQRQKLK